jgi:hypothetical protein
MKRRLENVEAERIDAVSKIVPSQDALFEKFKITSASDGESWEPLLERHAGVRGENLPKRSAARAMFCVNSHFFID